MGALRFSAPSEHIDSDPMYTPHILLNSWCWSHLLREGPEFLGATPVDAREPREQASGHVLPGKVCCPVAASECSSHVSFSKSSLLFHFPFLTILGKRPECAHSHISRVSRERSGMPPVSWLLDSFLTAAAATWGRGTGVPRAMLYSYET